MLSAVKRVFSKHPLISNCAVYGTLYVGAEFSQQTVNKKFLAPVKQPYDTGTLARYGVCAGEGSPAPAAGLAAVGATTPAELGYDTAIIARYAFLGVSLYPTVYYYWYRWLDGRFVGTALPVVARKLLLDQFLLTPPLLVVFYVSMSLMERKRDLLEECRNKLLPTFKTSCMFWLPAQSLNFLLVPPAARVVYVGSCAFVWVNILCWFKRQSY